MKVGLVRHFEVVKPQINGGMTSAEFKAWQDGYDTADVKIKPANIKSEDWQICYCSTLPRAFKTAKTIYTGEIIQTNLLREIEIAPAFNTKFKLPFMFWTVVGRCAWYFSHKSQSEKYMETKKRAHEIVSDILNKHKDNVLLVSHGAIMYYIRKELLINGFTGPSFTKAKNGFLYTFQK